MPDVPVQSDRIIRVPAQHRTIGAALDALSTLTIGNEGTVTIKIEPGGREKDVVE